jgi:hypothetical protein
MRRLLLRCYPARWRARYGDEFAELLGERPLGPFDVADVLLGAVDAHLHLRGLGAASDHRRGFAMSLRIGGIAALLGGVLWVVAIAASSATDADTFWNLVAVVATFSLLVAMTGLSAFQARRFPRLIWAAFGIPAIGAIVSVVGLVAGLAVGDRPFVGDLSPWWVWLLGTLLMVVGSGLFAIATWRANSLSRPAAAVLAAGAITAVAILPALMGLVGFVPEALMAIVPLLALFAFAAGWAGLGVSALRLDRTRTPGLLGSSPS